VLGVGDSTQFLLKKFVSQITKMAVIASVSTPLKALLKQQETRN
jgi:hypothetical protein